MSEELYTIIYTNPAGRTGVKGKLYGHETELKAKGIVAGRSAFNVTAKQFEEAVTEFPERFCNPTDDDLRVLSGEAPLGDGAVEPILPTAPVKKVSALKPSTAAQDDEIGEPV